MESFEQIANQYQPMIHKIIHSLHVYKNIDEFYQIGLIALWDAYKSFNEEKGKFCNFAYSWIRGKILSEMAKDHKLSERFVYPEEEYWELAADRYDDKFLEKEFLQTYGQTLSKKETKWLIMACFTGLSVKEIAESENVSVSAVKQWRASARRKLLEQLHTMD